MPLSQTRQRSEEAKILLSELQADLEVVRGLPDAKKEVPTLHTGALGKALLGKKNASAKVPIGDSASQLSDMIASGLQSALPSIVAGLQRSAVADKPTTDPAQLQRLLDAAEQATRAQAAASKKAEENRLTAAENARIAAEQAQQVTAEKEELLAAAQQVTAEKEELLAAAATAAAAAARQQVELESEQASLRGVRSALEQSQSDLAATNQVQVDLATKYDLALRVASRNAKRQRDASDEAALKQQKKLDEQAVAANTLIREQVQPALPT